MDVVKSFFTGLATVILGAWALWGFGTIYHAGNAEDFGGFSWTWLSWLAITPQLTFVGLLIFALLWALGDKVRGE